MSKLGRQHSIRSYQLVDLDGRHLCEQPGALVCGANVIRRLRDRRGAHCSFGSSWPDRIVEASARAGRRGRDS
jgi:hypothetical protein